MTIADHVDNEKIQRFRGTFFIAGDFTKYLTTSFQIFPKLASVSPTVQVIFVLYIRTLSQQSMSNQQGMLFDLFEYLEEGQLPLIN